MEGSGDELEDLQSDEREKEMYGENDEYEEGMTADGEREHNTEDDEGERKKRKEMKKRKRKKRRKMEREGKGDHLLPPLEYGGGVKQDEYMWSHLRSP